MSLRLTINVPGAGRGQPIEVPGLGVFPNGETSEVSDARVQEAVLSGAQPDVIIGDDLELICGDEDAVLGFDYVASADQGLQIPFAELPVEAVLVDEPEAPVEAITETQDASDAGGNE